jgi:predicted Zn-dependent protease
MLTARNNVEALEYFRYALKGQPGNHEYMAHVLWAERLTNHSSPEECRRQLLALSVIDDKHARMWAWTMLGRLARVEGNEEACNEAYRKVLVTDSTNHEATRELRLRERRSSEDKSDGLLGKFFK